MPNYSTDPSTAASPTATPTPSEKKVAPEDLTRWLHDRLPSIREQWMSRIEARDAIGGSDWHEVVGIFVGLISSMLVPVLGPLRREVAPLWIRVAELFGRTAAERGLAAGEVIEELQILRELVIRDLYKDPPGAGAAPLSLRDVLLLNRAVDRIVTHGSVGHTDALFFKLFDGDLGESGSDPENTAEAVKEQLGGLRDEVRGVLALASGATYAGDAEH
jgi:hypothetical protein